MGGYRVHAVLAAAALAVAACESSSPSPPPLAPDAGGDAAVDRFDTSAIVLDEEPGAASCRLSADRRDLLVRVRNDGDERSPVLAVEVATVGTPYALRVAAMELPSGAGVELAFDRGPVAGFGDGWEYEITIDPEGVQGPPRRLASGRCGDLRSRATAATRVLRGWYDVETGLWNRNEWWRGANMLEATIDHARETGASDHLDLIAHTFAKASGRVVNTTADPPYVISNGNFLNDFYDDEGWWALAWVKAYDLTHRDEYLAMAKTIFAAITEGWTVDCGGGVFWRTPHHAKNAISNELFLTLAARLHLRTPGDAGPGSYLDWARREWAWFRASGMITAEHDVVDGLSTSCAPGGHAYTYNQGVILGGLVELWRATGDTALLDEAEAIAATALVKMTSADGVFIEAVCDANRSCDDGDGVQFKGVFVRNLALLDEVRPRAAYRAFLIRQSDAIWTQARSEADQLGKYWQGPFDHADASRQSSALDALTAGVRAAEVNLALRGSAVGSAACNGSQTADRAIDGSARLDSKWCSGGMTGQTLQVDLGAVRTVVGIRVRHAGAGGEDPGWNTRDFEVEVSADGQAWSRVVTVAGNREDVTTRWIPAVDARLVRLHVTRAQTRDDFPAARIYELEVLGVGHGPYVFRRR